MMERDEDGCPQRVGALVKADDGSLQILWLLSRTFEGSVPLGRPVGATLMRRGCWTL